MEANGSTDTTTTSSSGQEEQCIIGNALPNRFQLALPRSVMSCLREGEGQGATDMLNKARRAIMSREVWDDLLAEEERADLKSYLPSLRQKRKSMQLSQHTNDADEMVFMQGTLEALFLGQPDVAFFGDPVVKFLAQLRAGDYSPKARTIKRQRQRTLTQQHTRRLHAYHANFLHRVIRDKAKVLGPTPYTACYETDCSRVAKRIETRRKASRLRLLKGVVSIGTEGTFEAEEEEEDEKQDV